MAIALNHNIALKIYENIQKVYADEEPVPCDGPYVSDGLYLHIVDTKGEQQKVSNK